MHSYCENLWPESWKIDKYHVCFWRSLTFEKSESNTECRAFVLRPSIIIPAGRPIQKKIKIVFVYGHWGLRDYRIKVADWLSNVIDSIVFTMPCICVIVCECVIVPLFVLVKNVDCHKREGRSREWVQMCVTKHDLIESPSVSIWFWNSSIILGSRHKYMFQHTSALLRGQLLFWVPMFTEPA